MQSFSPPDQALANLSLEEIVLYLRSHTPKTVATTGTRHSSVAMVLREEASRTEVLFIQRARHAGDPWSGDIGFPGGKLLPDESTHAAAVRETFEELQLDLTSAGPLGQLDDLRGEHLPVTVSCLVYAAPPLTSLCFNHEVDDAFWYPLCGLLEAERHGTFPVRFGSTPLLRPGIMLAPGRPVLWGITYRLLAQFYALLGIRYPTSGKSRP